MTLSAAETLARRPPEEREAILREMGHEAVVTMVRSWKFWARPEQVAEKWAWRWWCIVTGRGWGKNRTGAEWVVDRCEIFAAAEHPHLIGLINATYGDVKALQLHGESGIKAVCERRGYRFHHPSTALEGWIEVPTLRGTWHRSTFEVHTADQPDRVRGRNFHTLWADEAGKWTHKQDTEGGTAFTNADLSLRAICPAGVEPQGCVTTTPRPIDLVRDLLAGKYGATAVTRGSLYDNISNLAASFIEAVLRRYAGTRLGAQEILGRLLDAVEGALWTQADLHRTRITPPPGSSPLDIATMLGLYRIVVGVDPSGSPSGDEAGVIVAGTGWGPDPLGFAEQVPHFYVLEDLSMHGASHEWARVAIDAYHRWGADKLVGEVNYGGSMVVDVIRLTDGTVNVGEVRATRAKDVRAEPVSALWAPAQSRGHLVGEHPVLEHQITTWTPKDKTSPDRMDGMVWCGHELLPELVMVDEIAAYGQAVADMRL